MKIVHLCTSDTGGAAQAAIRLHKGLLKQGIQSSFFSKYNGGTRIPHHKSIKRHKSIRHYLDYGLEHYILKGMFPPNRHYSEDTVLFTSPHALSHPERSQLIKDADIIHLHWTSHFLDYGHFFKNVHKPVIWTLHDMNPFTGGCHYSGECTGFKAECDYCPQLLNTNQPRASVEYLNYKIKSLSLFKNLHIVSPSTWLLDLSEKSRLFQDLPHHHIQNGFDTHQFTLKDKLECKKLWNIPVDRINLLFAAHTLKMKMKGFDLLLSALKLLPKGSFHLTVVGKNIDDSALQGFPFKVVGYIGSEQQMATLYNAADLFVTPSLRDNLPNTVAESLLCGTPVVGFRIGGIAEMIVDGFNGYFAENQSPESLAGAIIKYQKNPEYFENQKIAAHAKAKYDIMICVEKYLSLYKSVNTQR